ncbi:MAG: hypothetical protein ACT4PP_13560 [Sporichthyaceae bacterium]
MTAVIEASEVTPGRADTSAGPPRRPARRARPGEVPAPWCRRDGVVCGLLGAIGVVGLVLCWVGATGEAIWREQLAWLLGAIFATALVMFAAMIWVLVGLRRVRHGFRDLRRDQRVALGLTRTAQAVPNPAVAAEHVLVTSRQMTRAHLPECLLVRGKQTTALPAAELADYGRCGVCGS